jgi:protein TonB
MLESFVMVEATGQAVSTPTETLDPVAPYEPAESQVSSPVDIPKENSQKEDHTPKLVQPHPQQTQPVVSKKAPLQPAQPKPKKQQTSPSAKISQHSAAPSQTGSSDITLPVTHAKYLNNPHPAYPRQSKRLGEQGTVLLAVEIDIDGAASQVKVQKSSGHPRLDRTAHETVLKWRFIAGKKAGVPQKMWVNIPINFVLE